ncbi:hypothetical protein ACJRPK_01100 [Aquimarina sp. 2-A2]|uniref:hypothetical protein n=1 Tax=Aquimarina sp. 2-A2 TaxID=3382644 RepID=UPI00387F0CC1
MNFKTKLSSITIILLLAGFVNLEAQTNPKEIVEEFFIDYKNDGASKALDKLYSTNKWMERATDAITNLKSQLESLNEDYVGKYYGYELITEKKLAESYFLLSYLVKFDRQPIRYTFHFYKPDDKWVIYNFKFDANIGTEIEESAKLYYLDMN